MICSDERGAAEITIDTTLAELERQGFIKGESYAQNWIDRPSAFQSRAGKKVLKRELVGKGIDKTTADNVLDAIDDTDEVGIALQVAQKQAVHYRTLVPHVAKTADARFSTETRL